MGTVNAPNNNLDPTVRVYDRFYGFDVQVPTEEWDIVNSFFASVFKTKVAAANFSTALFRVAQETNVPVLTLLSQMQNQNGIQVTGQLAYYLNSLRSPSTLLGVNSTLTPNFYTARNILP
jgi:hypothetical protein